MIEELTNEQRDILFERLVTSASDIICEVLGLPKRTFEELQELFDECEQNQLDIFTVQESEPV